MANVSGLSTLQELIEDRLKNLSFPAQPAELYEPIRYTLSLGGKRMRPALTLMACEMFGVNHNEAISAALGIELFHNFTLLHDDIMDQAPMRRGNQTVHEKWDTNVAILSGDAMFVKSYDFVADCDPKILKDVLHSFNSCALRVCEGQQLDLNFELRNDVSIEEYLQMIEYKTASLVAASLEIGGLIGGANREDANKLYEFGRNIGIAFQLQDDILDTYGDPNVFGKRVGGDIVSNKKTFLILKAIELASPEQKARVLELLQLVDVQDEEAKIVEITQLYDELDVKRVCEDQMDIHFQEGMKVLDEVDAESSKKEIIRSLAENLMVRAV